MSIVGLIGFGGLAHDANDMTVTAGTFSYTTDTPNTNTDRALNQATAVAKSTGYIPWTAAKTHFWIHYHYKTFYNGANNDQCTLGWGNGSTLMGGISFVDSTNLVTIVVNGAVVATSATAVTLSTWESFHMEVTIDASTGSIDVYHSGDLITPIVSFSGDTDPTALTDADTFHFNLRNLDERITNLIAMDPDDATGIVDENDFASPAISVFVPDTDSATYSDWVPDSGGTGYTQIDERPYSDADYVEATAVAEASTFLHEPSVGSAAVVTAVKWIGRITRSGTDAGAQLSVRRRQATTDDDETAVAAPGAGHVSQIWDTKVGGGAWTPADLDATEFGVLSVT